MKYTVSTIKRTGTSLREFVATLAAFLIINALIMVPAVAVIREFIDRLV